MKLKQIRFFAGILLFLAIGISCSSQDEVKNVPYKIVIKNMYMGHVQYITTITNDSLTVFHDNFGADSSLTTRALKAEEKEMMLKAIHELPLDDLEKNYINDAVEDGTQIDFIFEIDGETKSVYISNKLQEDLAKFVESVVKLLPSDHIGYNERVIRY
ncbi:MAG: hypothetical protein A2W91_10205 [Bacteroidetes bacterium GWF2_38_335]|nr:MAG: hypothetical protein A2W91_10205 [Bacteroidetes bacterium GWF2_38_335]HBS88003.1 hypothetical protein [Bacteroidales bacterium]